MQCLSEEALAHEFTEILEELGMSVGNCRFLVAIEGHEDEEADEGTDEGHHEGSDEDEGKTTHLS